MTRPGGSADVRRGSPAVRHLITGLLLAAGAVSAAAEPTVVDVHVLSRDAKFVGSNVGGARITLTDAETGELLAQGVTEGSTGDTELIMNDATRWESLVTDGVARFRATLDLEQPRRITVQAHGPLNHPRSANTVTATQWLMPGRGAGTSGWILEMPGLIVEPVSSPTLVSLDGDAADVPVEAEVRMMCGCPLTPDGTWDSNEFEITARVLLDSTPIAATRLEHTGEPSRFSGVIPVMRPGHYRLQITAHQPRTGNAGVYEQTLVVH